MKFVHSSSVRPSEALSLLLTLLTLQPEPVRASGSGKGGAASGTSKRNVLEKFPVDEREKLKVSFKKGENFIEMTKVCKIMEAKGHCLMTKSQMRP